MQLDQGANDAFADFLPLMETNRDQMEEDLVNEVYSFALNYCIQQSNTGKSEWLEYAFALYQQLLDTGLLLYDGKMLPQQFKNIVSNGCRTQHLEWVATFIEAYKDRLVDDHDGIALDYNLAILRYHEKQYREAMRILKGIIARENHDIFYGMDARMYLWRAYFEHLDHLSPDEIDEMYKLYDSVRLYIDRNKKISALHQLQYRNFVRLFKRFMFLLLDQGVSKDREDLVQFREELAGHLDVANRTWFLQKVEEVIEDL